MAENSDDECHLENKSDSGDTQRDFSSFKPEENDDAMVGAASGVSPWAKSANPVDGIGSSASAAASRPVSVTLPAAIDVRHSSGPGLMCPKNVDHTHPLLDGLPFQFGPKAMAPRRSLTLRERVRVIELYRAGNSIRKIADDFGVGKTQIQTTLKRRNEYLTDYANEMSGESKRRTRKSPYDQVNDVCMEWFKDCYAEGLRVTGAMVQEKALQLAASLGLHDFKASNGWLDSFLKRSGIRTSSKEFCSDDSSAEGCEVVPAGSDLIPCSFGHSSTAVALATSRLVSSLSSDTHTSTPEPSRPGSGFQLELQPEVLDSASAGGVNQELPVTIKTEPVDTYSVKVEPEEDVCDGESDTVTMALCSNHHTAIDDRHELAASDSLETAVTASHQTAVVDSHGKAIADSHRTEITDNASVNSDRGENNDSGDTVGCPDSVQDNSRKISSQISSQTQQNKHEKQGGEREREGVYLCHVSSQPHNSSSASRAESAECFSHISTSDVLAVWRESVKPGCDWDLHHGDQMVSSMYRLWQDKRHLDLQLDVNGIIVWVHKLVVLAVSPCASLLFMDEDGSAANCLKVRLSHPVSRSAVAALVFFLYSGRLTQEHSTVQVLKHLAQALHITSLLKMCQVFLGTFHTHPPSDTERESQIDGEAHEKSDFCGPSRWEDNERQSPLSQQQADTDISVQASLKEHQQGAMTHSISEDHRGHTDASHRLRFREQHTSAGAHQSRLSDSRTNTNSVSPHRQRRKQVGAGTHHRSRIKQQVNQSETRGSPQCHTGSSSKSSMLATKGQFQNSAFTQGHESALRTEQHADSNTVLATQNNVSNDPLSRTEKNNSALLSEGDFKSERMDTE